MKEWRGFSWGAKGEGEGGFGWGYGSEIVLLKFAEQLLFARHLSNHLAGTHLLNPPNSPISLSAFYRWGN